MTVRTLAISCSVLAMAVSTVTETAWPNPRMPRLVTATARRAVNTVGMGMGMAPRLRMRCTWTSRTLAIAVHTGKETCT